MEDLLNIDWGMVGNHLVHMAIAYVLALPIALNREMYSHSAGFRTYPLVAVATCGYILVGLAAFPGQESGARIMHGLITGMGFIGGGAILKDGKRVRGLATAATLWATGAIGVAVGLGRYEIAIVLAVINFLTLQFIAVPVKEMLDGKRSEIGNQVDPDSDKNREDS